MCPNGAYIRRVYYGVGLYLRDSMYPTGTYIRHVYYGVGLYLRDSMYLHGTHIGRVYYVVGLLVEHRPKIQYTSVLNHHLLLCTV